MQRFMPFIDVGFQLLIFFVIASMLVYGEVRIERHLASLRAPIVEPLGPEERRIKRKINCNVVVYMETEGDRLRYIMLNGGEEKLMWPKRYSKLVENIESCGWRVTTRKDVEWCNQSDLTYNLVTHRLSTFRDYYKRQGKDMQPIVAILAPRVVPYYEVIRLYNYCKDEEGLSLSHVYLGTVANRDTLFKIVSPAE